MGLLRRLAAAIRGGDAGPRGLIVGGHRIVFVPRDGCWRMGAGPDRLYVEWRYRVSPPLADGEPVPLPFGLAAGDPHPEHEFLRLAEPMAERRTGASGALEPFTRVRLVFETAEEEGDQGFSTMSTTPSP